MTVVLVELYPYDPVGATVVTVRLCSHNDARVTNLNGVPWWPVLTTKGKFGQRSVDAGFGGALAARSSGIGFTLEAFPNAARYIWGDKTAKVWVGDLGAAWGSYTQIFEGLSGAASAADGRMSVPLRVDDVWFGNPLLNVYYGGTGGADGFADLKGIPKPMCFGSPAYIAPVLIDRTNNVYQFHGYGSVQGISTALDRLVRYGASTGNYASYAALIAAAIPAGSWGTCNAEGLVRLGAPPAGTLVLLASGDNGGADGWVRTPGKIIKRMATLAGATAGQIDSTSLADLDTAVPRNRSDYFTSAVTAAEAIRAVAAECSAGGAAGIGLLGKLIAPLLTIGSPALTLRTDGTSLPVTRNPRLLETGAPWWRMQLGAVPAFTVHGPNDYAAVAAADADNTATNAVTTNMAPSITIQALYTGTIQTGQLPAYVNATRKRGNTDVTTSATWAVAATSNCTATIGSATGLIALTAVTGDGYVDITSTLDGVTVPQRLNVFRNIAAVPVTPVAGSGATVAYVSTFPTCNSASYGSSDTATMTVRAGAAGQIVLSAPLSFTVDGASPAGTFGLYGIWQRNIASVWTDVGTETAYSSVETVTNEGGGLFSTDGGGVLTVNATITGLTNGTDYDLRFRLRGGGGSGSTTRARYASGTASATAS